MATKLKKLVFNFRDVKELILKGYVLEKTITKTRILKVPKDLENKKVRILFIPEEDTINIG